MTMPHRSMRSSPAVPRQSLRESRLVAKYHPDISLSRAREPDRLEVGDGFFDSRRSSKEKPRIVERRRFLCSSPRDCKGKSLSGSDGGTSLLLTRSKIRFGFRSMRTTSDENRSITPLLSCLIITVRCTAPDVRAAHVIKLDSRMISAGDLNTRHHDLFSQSGFSVRLSRTSIPVVLSLSPGKLSTGLLDQIVVL